MAVISTTRLYKCDLAHGVTEIKLRTPLMQNDAYSDVFEVDVRLNGSPVNLSKATVHGYLYFKPEKAVIPLNGVVRSGYASVTLTPACYKTPGFYSLAIQVKDNDVLHTVLKVDFELLTTSSEKVVDLDGALPSLSELLAEIDNVRSATSAAEAAANSANQAATNVIAAAVTLTTSAAPAIVQSVDGDGIISLTDSAETILAGVHLYGKTTQDGTPTPEAPVPMVNAGAGGSIGVNVRGKNLFDSSTLTKQNGAMFEVNENTVHIYTPSSTTYCAVRTSAITMHAGIRYVMSADVGDIVSGEPSLGFRDADTMRYVKRAYVSDGRIVLTYTPTETVRMYACLLVTGSTASDGDATFANIQLEVGTSAAAYEPFKDGGSMTIATPNGLPGLPVDSGGNYTDASGQQWICDEIDFVRKVHVKRVHHAIYDGGITPYSSAVRDNTIRITLYNNNPRLADNHVNAVGNMTVQAAVFYDDRVGHSVSNTGTSTGWHLSLPKAIVGNTVDSLRAWLANNPAEIMYVMATPVETPLSPEELTGSTSLTAQYPNTTAFNDAGAGMKIEYIADTKRYIDNKFAALAAASVDA